MTKFILKTYIKEIYSQDNNCKIATIKQVAKYNLRKNNKLYAFDLFLDGGVYYDTINVFYTKNRNEALNIEILGHLKVKKKGLLKALFLWAIC